MKISFILLSLLFYPLIANAQWEQVGQLLNGENESDAFGLEVVISNNGSVVAAGAYENDNGGIDAGQVKIFTLQNDTWIQLGSDIYGEREGDKSGESISLNGDGSIVAIGARFNDDGGPSAGHVRVYKFVNNTWVQIGQDIDGENQADAFGRRVELNDAGNKIIVGAPFTDFNGGGSGQISVYELVNNSWVQLGDKLYGSAAGDKFGWEVTMSADGNTIASGGWSNDMEYVRVYQYNGNNWVLKGQELIGQNGNESFGRNAVLSLDGNLLAVSEHNNPGGGIKRGAVKVYKYVNIFWQQIGDDINGEVNHSLLGEGMGFNESNTLFAVSNWLAQGRGKVYFYRILSNDLVLINATISGELGSEGLGRSLQLNNSGTRIVLGNAETNVSGTQSGQMLVYQNDSILFAAEFDSEILVQLSPNPNKGSFSLDFPEEINVTSVTVIDALGKTVYSETNIPSGVFEIDQKFTPGVYFVNVSSTSSETTIKMIVE